MPVYINGKVAGRTIRQFSPDDVVKRISEAIMESGRVGDLSRFSEEDLEYLRVALRGIADRSVKRIFMRDIMSGINIDKVVDVFETESSGQGYIDTLAN